MAIAWSKTVPYECYELGHCWTPNCTDAFSGLALHSFKYSLKVYGTLYLVCVVCRGGCVENGIAIPSVLFSPAAMYANLYLFSYFMRNVDLRSIYYIHAWILWSVVPKTVVQLVVDRIAARQILIFFACCIWAIINVFSILPETAWPVGVASTFSRGQT